MCETESMDTQPGEPALDPTNDPKQFDLMFKTRAALNKEAVLFLQQDDRFLKDIKYWQEILHTEGLDYQSDHIEDVEGSSRHYSRFEQALDELTYRYLDLFIFGILVDYDLPFLFYRLDKTFDFL